MSMSRCRKVEYWKLKNFTKFSQISRQFWKYIEEWAKRWRYSVRLCISAHSSRMHLSMQYCRYVIMNEFILLVCTLFVSFCNWPRKKHRHFSLCYEIGPHIRFAWASASSKWYVETYFFLFSFFIPCDKQFYPTCQNLNQESDLVHQTAIL